MNHYTYMLTDPESDMKYIGLRSCSCSINEDPYKGSSTIMTTQEKVRCTKVILGVFDTRHKAAENEIELHATLNVVSDENYWNRAASTSTGFNVSGLKRDPFTDEHIVKLSIAQKKRYEEGRGAKLDYFPKGELHPSRKYTSVYEWKNIDGNVFIGTNLEFKEFVGLKHIQQVTRLITGDRIQHDGWYIVKNVTSRCESLDQIYVEHYLWTNDTDSFGGTGFQLTEYLGIIGLSKVNKVIRGDRKSVDGWIIAS